MVNVSMEIVCGERSYLDEIGVNWFPVWKLLQLSSDVDFVPRMKVHGAWSKQLFLAIIKLVLTGLIQ